MTAIPTDRPVYEGEIATYWFEAGILVSLSKSTKRTVENIKGNAALIQQLTGGKPVPLLIYLCNSPVPDKATRRFSAEQLPKIYKAMAMVSSAGLASLVMKMVFTLKPAPIPTRHFTDPQEAKAWLQQYV
jgi:hypothetical protein